METETSQIQYCKISDCLVVRNGKQIYAGNVGNPETLLSDIYHALGITYPKFHKMDNLAKTGYLAAEILLGGTVIDTQEPKRDIGVAIMNSSSSIDADIRFQQSTAEFASPSIFVYTLPNVVIGEICIRFKITGEGVVFMTPSFDTKAMYEYLHDSFADSVFDKCLFGWINYNKKPEAFLAIIDKSLFEAIDENNFDTFVGDCMTNYK